jgi:hypothetical protein
MTMKPEDFDRVGPKESMLHRRKDAGKGDREVHLFCVLPDGTLRHIFINPVVEAEMSAYSRGLIRGLMFANVELLPVAKYVELGGKLPES